MDFESSYDWGDVGNIGAQGRTREEIRRQTQAMEAAFDKVKGAYEDAARKSKETNELLRKQMHDHAMEKRKQEDEQARLRAYRKQLASLKTALVEVKRVYGLS
jgi:ribosomal protein L29